MGSHTAAPATAGRLPTIIGIGAMKAGTSALHRYLDAHPDTAMSAPKELNFFFGSQPDGEAIDGWSPGGNWWRGEDWYRGHFPDDRLVGGECSPGYTSPDHPHVAERMAAVVPDARLICLVRDPLARAVSQYRHHVRDGTETRDLDEALLDPDSQYVTRSRFHAALRPFLRHFPRGQLLVVAQEDLHADRAATLRRVHEHAGLRPHWSQELEHRWHVAPGPAPDCPTDVAAAFHEQVADDVARLRELVDTRHADWLTRRTQAGSRS